MADDSDYDEEEMMRLREAVIDVNEIRNPPEVKICSEPKEVLYRKFTRMMDER